MGMRTIYNHADQPIYTMYNGEIFEIPALSQVSLPDELALFFVSYYGPRGLSFEPIGSQPQPSVRCQYCGKEFGDKERPHHALKQHIRVAHRHETVEEKSDNSADEEEIDAGDQTTDS